MEYGHIRTLLKLKKIHANDALLLGVGWGSYPFTGLKRPFGFHEVQVP